MTDIFQIVENNGTPKDIGDSKARADIAENFSTNKEYSVGSYCLYEGVLYRFTTTHTGSWNSSHVVSVNLADDKVSKSGDTMTNILSISTRMPLINLYNNSYTRGVATTTGVGSGIYMYDNNNNKVGYILNTPVSGSTTQRMEFRLYNTTSTNEETYAYARVELDENKNLNMTFTKPEAWRTGLNAAAITVRNDFTGINTFSNQTYILDGKAIFFNSTTTSGAQSCRIYYRDTTASRGDKFTFWYVGRNSHNDLYQLPSPDNTTSGGNSYYEIMTTKDWGADSGWLPLTSTSFTGTIYYRKIGKLVQFNAENIKSTSAINANSGWSLGQLVPSEYRPSKLATIAVRWYDLKVPSTGFIDASGYITLFAPINSAVATTNTVCFTAIYFIS